MPVCALCDTNQPADVRCGAGDKAAAEHRPAERGSRCGEEGTEGGSGPDPHGPPQVLALVQWGPVGSAHSCHHQVSFVA